MTTTQIGNSFPDTNIYGHYEHRILADISQQVDRAWPSGHNVVLSLTWTGSQTAEELAGLLRPVDRLFLVSTVDEAPVFFKKFVDQIRPRKVYQLGNFDSPHQFNFCAIVCLDHFAEYNTQDLILKDLKYRWISYNRKPHEHRRTFVHALRDNDLLPTGIVTLGRQFPGDDRPELYLTIGERDEDYEKYGHWYPTGTVATPHEIPHDLFSLHNWHYWQHHFLHIVGCTWTYNDQHLFTNQIDFKPIIGLRPFVINGQTRKYAWWRDQGFRTFESWFPTNLIDPPDLTQELIQTVKYINSLSLEQLQDMYNDMLPDLLHNRQHWYTWAQEQKTRAGALF
jgi:hypothetical protein